jgi:hypothetical protein
MEGQTMSTITAPRTVRASDPAKTSQSRVTKPLSVEDAALKALSSSSKDESALATVAQIVLSDGLAGVEADLKRAQEEAAGFRATRSTLVSYRTRAVKAALAGGFTTTRIAREYGMSVGAVGNVSSALKIRNALKSAGVESAPSVDAIARKMNNAPKGGAGAAVSAIKATKTVPAWLTDAPAPASDVTAAQCLKSVQRAHDLLKSLTRADGDAATITALQTAVDALADRMATV